MQYAQGGHHRQHAQLGLGQGRQNRTRLGERASQSETLTVWYAASMLSGRDIMRSYYEPTHQTNAILPHSHTKCALSPLPQKARVTDAGQVTRLVLGLACFLNDDITIPGRCVSYRLGCRCTMRLHVLYGRLWLGLHARLLALVAYEAGREGIQLLMASSLPLSGKDHGWRPWKFTSSACQDGFDGSCMHRYPCT